MGVRQRTDHSSSRRRPGSSLRRWLFLGWIPTFAGMTIIGCAQAPDPAQQHHHPTIVSLNPCSDAVLAELADPGQLLGISHYSHDPASTSMELENARRFRAVSGSVEEVLALGPDIVVADPFLPAATRGALESLGMRVETISLAGSVAQSKRQVDRLAGLAGRAQRGVRFNARIDTALARAAPADGAEPVPAIVWQAGGIVPGAETLVADLLARTGFDLASAARGLGQADTLPLEAMLADPPAVILVAGDRRAGENRMLSHPALTALDRTRVEAFDPSLLWCGGPTIVRAAERLAEVRKGLQ